MDQPDVEVEEPLAMPRWTVGRVLAVTVMLGIVLFWAAIFGGVFDKENRDRLADRAFVERTHERCRTLRADLAELPNAAYIDDAAERADVLDDANSLVERFIRAVADDDPGADDRVVVDGWLDDWRTYLRNREDFADRLRSDPDAQLLLDESPLGDSVDRTIEIFADVNDMPDCATPGDVG